MKEERRNIRDRTAAFRRILNHFVGHDEVRVEEVRGDLPDGAVERIMARIVQAGLAELKTEGHWVVSAETLRMRALRRSDAAPPHEQESPM